MSTISVGISENLLVQLDELSTQQKQLVVRHLIDSLFENSGESWEQAWEKELLRRQADLDAGRSVLIPLTEAKAQIEAQLREFKS